MFLKPKDFASWPERYRKFYDNFLDMTTPVQNPACLPKGMCKRENFRQFAEGDMAVGVDLVHVGNSFTIRDFKAAVTNQGNGDVAMACLTEQADKSKVRLDLRAFPDHELDENGQLKAILPEQKLIKFYESHGFFIIPGRHDYAPKMFRPPQRGSF